MNTDLTGANGENREGIGVREFHEFPPISKALTEDSGLGFQNFAVILGTMTERIAIDPDICNGKPVIRGTRIAVQTVLEFLAAGDSTEDVLEEYPSLKREDVQACIDYASRLMANHYSIVPTA